MKLLDIAQKEMIQAFRSLTGIMFMFVVPILVTGLFYFMFGGIGDEGGFDVPQTSLLLVNLDTGELPPEADLAANMPPEADLELSGVRSMGELLVEILQGAGLSELVIVTEAADAAAARTAVDNQETDVAMIIPANFTDALMLPDETATIELYHDPTLTLGPAIVEGLIRQFADNFVSTKIGSEVVFTQLADAGVPIDAALVQQVIDDFTQTAMTQGQVATPFIVSTNAAGAENDLRAEIVGQIMGGMMIFFAFFTGSGTLQSILIEEEQGTLARLFTTPTAVGTILGGKLLGTLITLTVQVTVLLLFGRFVFGINWGGPLAVLLAGIGIILISAATGLFLASMMQNTRQSGAVYGGVLTLTGMIGMITIFSGGVVASPAISTITLFVPQGWAVRGLQTAMQGGGPVEILPALAGLAVWMIVFVGIAQYRFGRRFS